MPGEPVQVTLLGPQRRPTVNQVVGALDLDGPLATVTAGWLERESDDAELSGLLDRPNANLGLYGRWRDVQERDRDYALAEREHGAVLHELRLAHLVQLESALEVLYAIHRRSVQRPRVHAAALADAEAVVRLIDEAHLGRVREAHADFAAARGPQARPWDAEHRAQV